MNNIDEIDYLQRDNLLQEEEYKTRVYVFYLFIPPFVKGIPLNIRLEFRLFKGTREGFDSCYNKYVKGNIDEEYIKPVVIKYSKTEEIENCNGCIDRNIKVIKSKRQKDIEERNEENRNLKSGY